MIRNFESIKKTPVSLMAREVFFQGQMCVVLVPPEQIHKLTPCEQIIITYEPRAAYLSDTNIDIFCGLRFTIKHSWIRRFSNNVLLSEYFICDTVTVSYLALVPFVCRLLIIRFLLFSVTITQLHLFLLCAN